ncbi:MAG: hypothetical protein LBD46_00735 [Endomicrobium sp.]|jgi:hypothetical protein|nr:hypothetical protein [Endomicrobium sp.]
MEWKTVAEHTLKLKNLANNEEIKSKLEGLSLYNCQLKQILDGEEAGTDITALVLKENELKNNTLAKIYELQKETEQAQTTEEEASKVIECFLYIDNYLSLYSEPELFFIKDYDKLQLCDSVELLNSKKKFGDIVQSMFFFQELNEKAHISIHTLCSFLRESVTNVSEFIIDKTDYVMDRLDILNRTVLEGKSPDIFLRQLYPFILIINFTAQKLMLHRFTSIYPSNVNKKVFQEALKQKEYALDRLKAKIIKRAAIIKQLKERINSPMNQEFWFDTRCIEIYDEGIVVKRKELYYEDGVDCVIITADRINKCCMTAYWTAFLAANDKKLAQDERNAEADEWLNLYLAESKNDKYAVVYSLHKFLIKNEISNSYSFNNIKIKPVKKSDTAFQKVMPLWLVGVISVILAAVFILLIIYSTKSIVH